jgi:hypothetical protein
MLRHFAVVLAAAATLLAVGTPSAWGESSVLVAFTYSVNDLPAGSSLSVLYNSGVVQSSGGVAQARSGAMSNVWLLSNALLLSSPTGAASSVDVTQNLYVGSAPVTGVAMIPTGASVTLTNPLTHQTISLSTGPFSISTGVGGLGAKPPADGTRVVRCRGTARACEARISIAGGASNRKVIIRLTSRGLRFRSVTAIPRTPQLGYSLNDGHFRRSSSEYAVTLNAAQSNPRGSRLILTFAAF